MRTVSADEVSGRVGGHDPPDEPITDAESVDDVYRRLGRELLQLATLLTGSRLAGEEIVHDVFTEAIPRWDRISRHEHYLRRAVVNRSRSHGRRVTTARRWRAERDVVLAEPELDETWELVRKLPSRQRIAVVLRVHLDLSYRDVASLIGCAEATARSLVFRGLDQIRKELS